jgi:hypothetical protein
MTEAQIRKVFLDTSLTEAQIRKVFQRTAQIREESWVGGQEDGDGYGMSMEDAAIAACKEGRIPDTLAPLVWLSLSGWWNDVLAWANGQYDSGSPWPEPKVKDEVVDEVVDAR